MRFVSTDSGEKEEAHFSEAVLRCLPARGLFVPEATPDLRPFFLHIGDDSTYGEMVSALTPAFFENSLNPAQAARVAAAAFNFEPELSEIEGGLYQLDLSRGPTGNFKDFGLGFLAALLEEFSGGSAAGKITVVTAIRGSTGPAVAHAFRRRKNVSAVLLYPENSPSIVDGKVRGIDAADCVGEGGNLIPIQVEGDADTCQDLVNAAIRDRPFSERFRVTSANAVNIGRLLPQSFFYFYAFVKLKKKLSGELFFSVPSGNLGNLVAGLYAWKCGLPVNGLVAARPPTLDITRPSNRERLDAFYAEAPAVMKNMVFPVEDGALDAAQKIAKSKEFDGHLVVFKTVAEQERRASEAAPPAACIKSDLESFESALASC